MNRAEIKKRASLYSGRTDVLNVIAEIIGKSPESVCSRLTGKSQFTASEINKLRKAFHLSDTETVRWFIAD